MPLIPDKLNFLPEFEGREHLYGSIVPSNEEENGFAIRILTVMPNDDYLAPIEASLSVEVLLLPPYGVLQKLNYNAVSYFWGDTNELENVKVQTSNEGVLGSVHEVPVTKKLTAALRQFRVEASAKKEPLRLWVDALCINQSDSLERQFQVSMMKWIFWYALSVWIWLGESDELVERGLTTLVEQANATHLHMVDRGPAPATMSLDEEVFRIKQFAAVCALPYWRRGWTFQENMLPQRRICYGELKIDLPYWRTILIECTLYVDALQPRLGVWSSYSYMSSRMSNAEKTFLQDMKQLITTFAPFALAEEIFLKHQAGELPEFTAAISVPAYVALPDSYQAQFLQDTFYRTSDPRDAVFALHPLIPELMNLDLNYADSPEHIFSIATEALLRNSRDGLRDLGHWFHPQASPQLPSWVFDFTHCNIGVDENGRTAFLTTSTIRGSDASAGSPFRVKQCDGTSMHVAGFMIDEIFDISHFVSNTLQPNIADIGLSWVRLAHLHLGARAEVSRQEYGRYTRALLRTFGYDRQVKDFTLADLDSPDLVQWEDGPLAVLAAIHERSHTVAAAGDGSHRIVGFEYAMRRHWRRAKFFVTKNFRMGLAPLDAAVGDRIAILASGNVPFVLRPVPVDYAGEEAYRIIGGCYVDGIQNSYLISSNSRDTLTNVGRRDGRGSRIHASCPSL
jgi:hypothetical protein